MINPLSILRKKQEAFVKARQTKQLARATARASSLSEKAEYAKKLGKQLEKQKQAERQIERTERISQDIKQKKVNTFRSKLSRFKPRGQGPQLDLSSNPFERTTPNPWTSESKNTNPWTTKSKNKKNPWLR